MRLHEIINEVGGPLPADIERWYNAKAVQRLKPTYYGGSWKATVDGYSVPLERVIDTLGMGDSQAAIGRAINQIRAHFKLPAKAFPPIDTTPVRKTSPKLLYHGTSFENALGIQRMGLVPQVGKLTASAHSHAAPLIYAGTRRDFGRVVLAAAVASHNPATDSAFLDRAAILVLPNDGHWYQASSARQDISGSEDGDYYRTTRIMPTRIIHGVALRRFFDRLGRMPSDFDPSIAPDPPKSKASARR